jgi:hypothetical protein
VAAGGSQRLAKLFESAARRVGARPTRSRETIDMGLIYGNTAGGPHNAAQSVGTATPTVRLYWEGWQETSRRPEDSLENVSPDKLEQAGQTLALALMVLGRETAY